MKLFGDKKGLPESIINSIDNIINTIPEEEFGSIYYGFPIIELNGQNSIMKLCIVSRKKILLFSENENELQLYNRHFIKMFMDNQELYEKYNNQDTKIFCNININSQFSYSNFVKMEDIFTEHQYNIINSLIQKVYGLNGQDAREILNQNSIGNMIKQRNNEISFLDQDQFKGMYSEYDYHLRIRGLAGSGKTILLVKRMAYLHYKNRELEIVYTFYTKTLKQYVLELFKNFYRDFDQYNEPDLKKIHILHSWGGAYEDGLYSYICKENGHNYKKFNEVSGNDRLGTACKELLDATNKKLKRLFDYVFIDEAQDFSLMFFKMALASLTTNGKLFYAYDELQTLTENQSVPTKQEIFGSDADNCKDINLSICYRTPKKLLVTAHALGLGIYHKNTNDEIEIINMIQDFSIWEAIGYEVKSGELNYGKDVVLARSEHLKHCPNNPVKIQSFKSNDKQFNYVLNKLEHLISNEDVLLEDLLIIDLNSLELSNNFNSFKKMFNKHFSDEKIRTHLVNKDNAIKLKKKNSIPYTTIYRAKGNEANIVFVINADKMSNISTYSRNIIFTAMTRAKFKVYVLGINSKIMDSFKSEYETIKEKKYSLDFKYPTEKQLEKIKTIAKKEEIKVGKINKANDIIGNDDDILFELLRNKYGDAVTDELLRNIKKTTENN